MSTDKDPFAADFAEAAHNDDWGVPCVYAPGARHLVAGELRRVAEELTRRADVLEQGGNPLAPAVPRDELAGMLRPFVSSSSDEWEMADELITYLDIRPKPEGETP